MNYHTIPYLMIPCTYPVSVADLDFTTFLAPVRSTCDAAWRRRGYDVRIGKEVCGVVLLLDVNQATDVIPEIRSQWLRRDAAIGVSCV